MPSIAQFLDRLKQDVRYALRGLAKAPGFAAAIVLTIGLGIGANVAMFGVVDRLMFRPYPYLREPATAHRIYLRSTDRGITRTSGGYEYTRYVDFKKWTTSFSHYAAFANQTMAVGLGDATRDHRVGQVSASFFDFFDARPALGRFFTPAEDVTPRGAPVAVLGYGFWKREYGGENVIGRTIHVANIPSTIVGVAPEGFTGVMDTDPALYIPITTYAGSRPPPDGLTYFTRYNWGWMSVMVRRKPGVTAEQASADATQAYRRSWDLNRELEPQIAPSSVARPEAVVGAMRVGGGPDPGLEARTALWVSGVAAIVLLIACANVANLLLARGLKRRREIALRLALGVSRGRLVAQSLTESLVLSMIGCLVGLLVALWGGAAIRGMLFAQGASIEVFTDWRTLGIALGLTVVAAVFTGLVPAVLTTRGDLASALKAGAREGTYHRSRARNALLVAQGALSVVLLVGAALFVRSLDRVKSMSIGYDATKVLQVGRNLRGLQLSDTALIALRRQMLARAQALPVVERAAYASTVPFWSTSSTSLFVAGIDSVRRLGSFTYQTATDDFFDVMGTRIVRGRGFTSEDRATAPRIAIVSEGMARVLWPGQEALGQCLRVGADTAPCSTVVGIAEDIVQRDVTNDKRYHYYMPIEQYRPANGSYLLVKLRGDPAVQGEEVRKAIQTVMPAPSYVTVRSLREAVDQAQRSWRLGATMFVAFGVLALIVSAMGLYGVIAYDVAQRMHELGVRVALGAQAADILRLVVGQGVRFALAGIALGSAIALVSARWVEPLLFKQSARDPVVYGSVAVLLLLVAIAASLSPASRASRADPNTALRAE
jgi:putative ABC transport system permease protein